jgi:hypothetical protein
LNQAANLWHAKLRVLIRSGFTGSGLDPYLFTLKSGATFGYALIPVDHAMLVGPSNMISGCKQLLQSPFQINDMGPAELFLGLKITLGKYGCVWVGKTGFDPELLDAYVRLA